MAENQLPDGLYACAECGNVRGTTSEGVESVCLCEALRCERCGTIRTRRPCTVYYNPRDGKFWHVPYYAVQAPCYQCHPERRPQ